MYVSIGGHLSIISVITQVFFVVYCPQCVQWRIQSVYQGEGGIHGERAKREPITGVWGQSPQRGPGAEPLVGVRGAKPP